MPLINLEPFPNRATLERVVLTAALTTFFVAGYFSVGLSTNPAHAHELTTSLDERIPFIPSSVWVYLSIFPMALSPLFVVRCLRLFRRTAIAYAVVIAISLVSFAAFPVTSARLRVVQPALDVSRPSLWAISVVYCLDPPYNLFPSLHLSIAALAAFSVWKVSKLYGMALFVSLGFVAVSVCTVKQHCIVDVFGGLALATLAGTLIVRPYHPLDSAKPAYSWRGPTTYLAFMAVSYAGFYIAYVLGKPQL
jgi:membrane-associated phospholipid phosphatase